MAKVIDTVEAWKKAQRIYSDPVLLHAIRTVLDSTGSVDAVEVVRCKDCRWYAPNNDGCWIGCALDTRHPDDVPKADDFCSYGERKDNG